MKVNAEIFRAYDIRGRVGEDITPDIANLIGRGYGTYIRRARGKVVAVGRDNRLAKYSSAELQEAFIGGALSTGCDVVQIGISTSPLLYFAVAYWNLDGGVNVTGSHNSLEYNGFKLVARHAQPIASAEIQSIRNIIEREDFATGSGHLSSRSSKLEYFTELGKKFCLQRPIKIVVDAGNGVAGLFAPDILRQIGCEVVELFCDPDGRFPNHLPDPEMEENVVQLKASVVTNGAALGLALDGDGDRLGLVDERGTKYESDYILILLARDFLQRHPSAKVIVDVKCSQNVIDDIKVHNGEPYIYKSGHSLIKKKMREDGILLAGEASGHMFFAEDYYGFDDAVFAACRVAEIISKSEKPVSAHFANLPRLYSTPELRLPCPDSEKFRVVDEIVKYFSSKYDALTIDGIRINFVEGWALIRASNTSPYLTVRIEAKTKGRFEEIERIVFGKLAEFPSVSLLVGWDTKGH